MEAKEKVKLKRELAVFLMGKSIGDPPGDVDILAQLFMDFLDACHYRLEGKEEEK